MLEIVLWILVAIAGLILMDQLLLWIERKGWIYYRKTKRKTPVSMADVFTGSNVFDQSARHVQEAQEVRPGEEDEDDGDDDGKRKPKDRLT